MKSACYYIGEQEEDPQEREVDRKDRRKAAFSSGSSKKFRKRIEEVPARRI